jgi:RNA polymerase sigma factor (sigma-70 family)
MPSPEGDDSWEETKSLGSFDEKLARAAHDSLVARLEGALLRLIERWVGRDTGIAREICQESFLSLWTHRQEVAQNTTGSPFNWLSVVAKNKVRDRHRSESASKRKGEGQTLSLDELEQDRVPSSRSPNPEESALRSEGFRRALSPLERLLVGLKLAGYSDAEIGARTELAPSALRVKWEVIRDKLRRNGLGPTSQTRVDEGRPGGESLGLSERG